jgi:hypothetical protein
VRAAAFAAAALLVAAACYHPNAETGQPCSPDGTCPTGQMCDMTQSPPTCVPPGTGGDGGVHDAPAPHDGRFLDAPAIACANGSACPPEAPVCDAMSGTCRGCRADAECTTAACEESTGQCIAEDQVAYVDGATNNSGSACTIAAPCATIAEGIAATTAGRTFVAIAPGTYMESVQLQGAAATVLSGPGSGAVASLVAITMFSGAPAMVIESLQVENSGGACVQLQSSSSTVTLYGDAIGPCDANGVTTQGSLTVERCRLTGSTAGGIGIQTMGGTNGSTALLDVEQTVVDGFATAIQPNQGAFVIRNDLLSRSTGTALRLQRMGGQQGSGIVDFVTIVDSGGAAVSCMFNNGTSTATITSSLFAENATEPSIDSSCLVSYSVWDDTSTPQGSNNGSGQQAVFVNAQAGDFHLAAGSPGINAADPHSTTTVDLDGAPRPSGGGFDCGAFQGQ